MKELIKKYIFLKACFDRGINEIAFIKNIIAFITYASVLAFLLKIDLIIFIPIFAILLFVFCFVFGYILLKKIRIVQYEVEFQNSLHRGIKIKK